MAKYRRWTREETIIAYALYCAIPFSKLNASNKVIQSIAASMGRTTAALVMKMGNLAALDPDFLATGRIGLTSNTKLDKAVFEEFSHDWPALSALAENLVKLPIFDIAEPVYNGDRRKKKTYAELSEKQERKFFRKAVMAAYDGRCCITGMTIPQMLIASHIKPYAVSDKATERANPANGLLLNAFYDRAFDNGLMTVLPDWTIKISDYVKDGYSDENTRAWLLDVEGTKIRLPTRFKPKKDLLAYHNEYVFLR